MAQAQVVCGLGIEANLSNGELSLHDYRKFLSRSDDVVAMPCELPRRRLKRKPATINLNQAQHYSQQTPQQQNQPCPNQEVSFPFQSPVSSAPSSPPPLSFCQSVVTLHGDLPTPISPLSVSSTLRPFSRPSSSSRASASRRIESFSTRLKRPQAEQTRSSTHHRASSDSVLLGIDTSNPTVKHNGAFFEILNPRKSFEGSRIVPPSLRSSAHSGVAMDQENPDPHPPYMAKELPPLLLDDMARPISASESAILSRTPVTPSMQNLHLRADDENPFAALPAVKEKVRVSSRPATPGLPKTPTHTLRQKVSRFFGSTEKEKTNSGPEKSENKFRDALSPNKSIEKGSSLGIPSPQADSDEFSIAENRKTLYNEQIDGHRKGFDPKSVSPLLIDTSEFCFGDEGFLTMTDKYGHSLQEENFHLMSGGLRNMSSVDSDVSDFNMPVTHWDDQKAAQQLLPDVVGDETPTDESPNTAPWRRPVYGTHSANRHHTLHDALRQLNTSNHSGITYDDITRYLQSHGEDKASVDFGETHSLDEKPWQPETWAKPETFRTRPLYSRASEGELSTIAPSTRPSIRPYARQIAAFMEGGDVDSASVTTVDTAVTDEEENAADTCEPEKREEGVKDVAMMKPHPEPKQAMPRTISYRARPLSSNPPDLDTPIFLAWERSSTSSSNSSTFAVAKTRQSSDSTKSTSNAEPVTVAVAAAPAPTALLRPQDGPTTRNLAVTRDRDGEAISWSVEIPDRGSHQLHRDTEKRLPKSPLPLPGATAGPVARKGRMARKIKKKEGSKKAPGCCCS